MANSHEAKQTHDHDEIRHEAGCDLRCGRRARDCGGNVMAERFQPAAERVRWLAGLLHHHNSAA